MAKPNPLAQGLNSVQRPPQIAAAPESNVVPASNARRAAPSRAGRVLIGGHFAPEVQTALKIVAAQERTTLQDLLTEAINMVLAKRGKPEIAGLPTK